MRFIIFQWIYRYIIAQWNPTNLFSYFVCGFFCVCVVFSSIFIFFLTSHNGWDKHFTHTHKKSSSLFFILSRERSRYSRWRPSRKTWWRGPVGAMLQLQAAFLPLSLHCNFIQLCPLHLPMRHFVTEEICLYCVKAFLSQIMKILKKKNPQQIKHFQP